MMKTYALGDAMTRLRAGALGLSIIILTAGLGCSGGGTTAALEAPGPGLAPASSAAHETAVLISEDEIARLPRWQQEKLSDSGWNQPYIAPREKTLIEPPTAEMLLADCQQVQSEGWRYRPRGPVSARQASWLGPDDPTPGPRLKGEYNLSPRDAAPPYGCNTDGTNGTEDSDHALEDVIRAGTNHLPIGLTYVLEGVSTANHFNSTGGAGNDAQSAVYQVFVSNLDGDFEEREYEELTYRADLAPGVPPGGDCSAATAYLVDGLFWKRFNYATNALPNLEEIELFNILIAPASEASALLENDNDVAGRYQEFYFGTVGECYGGAWIVGLESADTGCDIFDDSVNNAFVAENPYHYTPVYGVILKRWQQMNLAGMAGPWESWLGWPVWGPKAYANGAQMLTPRGAYYAWGVWFERGFIWWIDYDQEAYPNTPDEAQVYVWTGINVFCADQAGAQYQELAPVVYYGGSGELGVSVVVDSFRYDGADPWNPVEMDAERTYYEIALPANEGNPSGTGTVQVAMHAHPYGGVPNEDCSYDWYVWAFRDGTIAMGNEAEAQYVNHTFGNTIRNMEQVCAVRVQVTDADGNLGYGDSLPLHIGLGTGMGAR